MSYSLNYFSSSEKYIWKKYSKIFEYLKFSAMIEKQD